MGRQLTALGVEGSANKVGVGVCRLDGAILSNPRTTYVPPRGHGFMPRETAEHHQRHVLGLIRRAMDEVSAAVSAGGRKEETLRATAQAAGQSCQPPGERESAEKGGADGLGMGEAGVAGEPAREQRGCVRAEAVVSEREPLDAWSGLGFG